VPVAVVGDSAWFGAADAWRDWLPGLARRGTTSLQGALAAYRFLTAVTMGHSREYLVEWLGLCLAELMSEAGLNGRSRLAILNQTKADDYATDGLVDWYRVTAQSVLHGPGQDERVGGLQAMQLFLGLTKRLFLETIQVEAIVGLKHFLQQSHQLLSSVKCLGQRGEGVRHFANSRNSHLVPVVKGLLQPGKSRVGFGARHIAATDSVKHLL